MCGIAGIFHFDEDRIADKTLLKKISDVLSHRGPDGSGYYCKNNIGLGHRRLSIIDLSTGDQPMFNNDKSIAIIYNGEIYNYIELREELKALGHTFFTESDTEVIIRSYEQWGTDCQGKLNGMWAFSLWDEKKKTLFISRDRLGEKPLYYTTHDNSFIFGSEIKSLLAYGVPAIHNAEYTELYLCMGYMPAPFSLYKNILKLLPGHYLMVKNGSVAEHTYWDMPAIDEANMIADKSFVYEKFESLLQDSVRIRMRSDVPYGAFLSGGLDSASVVACMSAVSKTPVQTFTIGFAEKEFDERKLARDVAEKFKTNHFEFVVEPESFETSLQKILHHYDEPFGDSSAIPTGYVSKTASQKVKMVLTGDGGDEVLSGYNAYQAEKFAQQMQRIPLFARKLFPHAIAPVAKIASGSVRYKLNRAMRVLSYAGMPFNKRLSVKSSWYTMHLVEKLAESYGPQMKLVDFVEEFYKKYQIKDSFYKLMFFQFKILLPDDFLTKVDRMSMAYSLETRIPFLDYRIVEFMATVSKNVKMQGYERKSILRKSIGKQLPESLLKAPKRGFTVPVREWFKDKAFDSKLQSLYKEDFGLDKTIIKKIVLENREGKADLGNFIWMLFILKEWVGKT